MHRSFRIPEILDLIVSEIRLPPETHGRNRGGLPVLAALARTCTTFQGPALDRLWWHQTTLVNLLNCFPEGLIEKVEFRRDWNGKPALVHFRFLRPMSDKDWDRPFLYSRRIKSLTLREELHITSSDAFKMLCFGAHILPNLTELNIDTYVPDSMPFPSFQHFELLLCPHLVRITLQTPMQLLSRIIPTLTVQCPSLTAISLVSKHGWFFDLLRPKISQFVRTLVDIEELSVDTVDRAAFLHLGRLPTLKALRIENAMTSLSFDAFPSPPHMYPSLKFLRFGVTTLDCVAPFIDIISNSPLEIFEIGILTGQPTTTVAQRFFSALAAHCCHFSLQNIISCGGDGHPDRDLLDGVTLRPILCFANLVSLSLVVPFTFDLDDADLFGMARAWPRLESLSIQCITRPRTTLHGLSAFAQHCPHLSSLNIAFDATVVPERDEPGVVRVSQTALKDIRVADSWPITMPGPVASFISAIFSEAEVETWCDAEDLVPGSEEAEYLSRWEEVKQRLEGWSEGDDGEEIERGDDEEEC
ncbi:hypothetical protein C8R44DRAFT_915720 [Mycena epipterygia]|nr:hypothetical protein C8R44DRAFT_915720 [Mycena epipterygia]